MIIIAESLLIASFILQCESNREKKTGNTKVQKVQGEPGGGEEETAHPKAPPIRILIIDVLIINVPMF